MHNAFFMKVKAYKGLSLVLVIKLVSSREYVLLFERKF